MEVGIAYRGHGEYDIIGSGLQDPLLMIDETDEGYTAEWEFPFLSAYQFEQGLKDYFGSGLAEQDVIRKHSAAHDTVFRADADDHDWVRVQSRDMELGWTPPGYMIINVDEENVVDGWELRALKHFYPLTTSKTYEDTVVDKVITYAEAAVNDILSSE